MFDFTWGNIALCILIPLVAFFLARWLFQKDTEVESRRRGAAHLAGVLKKYGLKRLPDLLVDYSVGDYSGMLTRMKDFAALLMEDEDSVLKEFDLVYRRVLEAKLKTPEGRAYLEAQLREAKVVEQAKGVEPKVVE